MPNIYMTPREIKDSIPDLIPSATVKYNDALMRFCSEVSRFIDQHCSRRFFPVTEVRYFDRTGARGTRIDDVLSVSQLQYSEDDGDTYTALAESGNWLLTRGDQYNPPGSYNRLVINPVGTTLASWPTDFKALELTGIWAYADDRSDCWEGSGDTVQDATEQDASQTTLDVSKVEGKSAFGLSPRFTSGMLIRIGDEYEEVTNIQEKTLTVIRGRNGSTAAVHANGAAIDIWRAPEPVRQAVLIQAVRAHMRSLQGFADSRANAEVGQLFFLKRLDPEAQALLENYRLKEIPATPVR